MLRNYLEKLASTLYSPLFPLGLVLGLIFGSLLAAAYQWLMAPATNSPLVFLLLAGTGIGIISSPLLFALLYRD